MKSKLSDIKRLKNSDKIEIPGYSEKIRKVIVKKTIINVLILLSLLVITAIFKDVISPLSLISFNIYFILVTAFVVIFIGYFILSRGEVFALEVLKKKYIIYRIFDNISFIFKAISILLFLTFFVISTGNVSGSSMEENFSNNDKVLIWQAFYSPKEDDVIIIDNLDLGLIIKRVVATSDDKVEYVDDSLYVNDKFVEKISYEEYKKMLTFNRVEYDQVPKGYCMVLGDNRDNSIDSRYFGLVSNEKVVGKVLLTIYPFSNFGFA